jgi:hypothetical protein
MLCGAELVINVEGELRLDCTYISASEPSTSIHNECRTHSENNRRSAASYPKRVLGDVSESDSDDDQPPQPTCVKKRVCVTLKCDAKTVDISSGGKSTDVSYLYYQIIKGSTSVNSAD